jgi:CHAT domain-containing protein
MKRIILLFILLSFNCNLEAQESEYDQLAEQYKTAMSKSAYKDAHEIILKMTPLIKEKPDTIQGQWWGRLGNIAREIGKEELSNDALMKALKCYEDYPKKRRKAQEYLLYTYTMFTRYDKAQKLQLEILKELEAIEGKESFAYHKALFNLGNVYRRMQRFQEAEKIYLEVDWYCRKNKNIIPAEFEEQMLYAIGAHYYNTGDGDLAAPYFERQAVLIKELYGEEDGKYVRVLLGLGAVAANRNQIEEAELYYLKGLEVCRNAFEGNHPYEAYILYNLVEIYQLEEFRDDEKSERIHNKMLEIHRATVGEEHENYIAGLMSLGCFYMDQKKEYKKANECLLESGAKWRKLLGEDDLSFAKNVKNLGTTYYKLGEKDKAIACYEKGKRIWEKANKTQNHEYSYVLQSMIELELEQKNYDRAKQYCYQIIESQTMAVNDTINASNLKTLTDQEIHNLGVLVRPLVYLHQINNIKYEETKNKVYLKEALEAIQVGLEVNNNLRKAFKGERDKLSNLSDIANLASLAIGTGMELDAEQYFPTLFGYAELNKSILLLDAIKGDHARNIGGLPDSLIQKEIALQKKLATLEKDATGDMTPEQRKKLIDERVVVNNAIQLFQTVIETEYPDYYQLKYQNTTVKFEEIQDQLEPSDCLIEYFVADSIVYVFAISKEEEQLIKIEIKPKELGEKIKTLRQTLSNYEQIVANPKLNFKDYIETAHWFYKTLIAPILKNRNHIDRLIIVADGELGHLPFEVFLTTAVKTQQVEYKNLPYLMHDYVISYHYSATLWDKGNKEKMDNNNQMTAYAASYGLEVDSTLINYRTVSDMELRNGLRPIPAVKEEVETLKNLLNGAFYTGLAANEGDFKKEANQYSVIHLAMHGILNKERPLLSSLAFTENSDTINNNFLEAHEIADLDLNADLVVLSACETGYGKFAQGEGVLSLARSFMYAGTPSLVVSLWQVNDKSTAIIMADFYQNLSSGMPKDKALKEAKSLYIARADRIAAHPAFWSAFIQLGNRQPITLETKRNMDLWLGMIGGASLLLLGGAFWRRRKK